MISEISITVSAMRLSISMKVFTSNCFIGTPPFLIGSSLQDRLLYHDVRDKKYYLDDGLCLSVHCAHLRDGILSDDLLRFDHLYCSLCNDDHVLHRFFQLVTHVHALLKGLVCSSLNLSISHFPNKLNQVFVQKNNSSLFR